MQKTPQVILLTATLVNLFKMIFDIAARGPYISFLVSMVVVMLLILTCFYIGFSGRWSTSVIMILVSNIIFGIVLGYLYFSIVSNKPQKDTLDSKAKMTELQAMSAIMNRPEVKEYVKSLPKIDSFDPKYPGLMVPQIDGKPLVEEIATGYYSASDTQIPIADFLVYRVDGEVLFGYTINLITGELITE